MEEARKSLERTGEFLAHCEKTVQAALADSRINQWEKIDFEKHAESLAYFKLPLTEIRKASEVFRKSTKNILLQIEHWKNDIGNQMTDITMRSVSPERALTLAAALENECGTIKDKMDGLKIMSKILVEGDVCLRKTLTVKGLLPMARKTNSKEADNFVEGLEIYRFITKDGNAQGNDTKLYDYVVKANDIKLRLDNIKLPDMPGLARVMINHHIETTKHATELIRDFINTSNEKFMESITRLNKTGEEIHALQNEALLVLLKTFALKSLALGKNIIEFQFNKYILTELKIVSALLDNLYLFHHTLRYSFLDNLVGQIRTPGNPLNPGTMAAKKSDEFFSGLKGVLRTLRLLVSSLGGHAVLSDTELRQYLEQLLDNCPVFYSDKPADLKKVERLIDGYIEKFDKPFPYEDLSRIMKSTLAAYGDLVEKHIHSWKLEQGEEKEREKTFGLDQEALPATMGLLIKRIEAQMKTIIPSGT